MKSINIRRAGQDDKPAWLKMRLQLWPDNDETDMLAEMEAILSRPDEQPVFLALNQDGQSAGFLEGGIRNYADGCDTSPVGYIEGWYVEPSFRRQGVGAALVQAMENWTRKQGLTEMGSDTWLDNAQSRTAHQKLGYVEMEQLVHFAKKI
jgi:aminoglycoside 6'-N-acetyltransferase I